jgi:hypothetical protein
LTASQGLSTINFGIQSNEEYFCVEINIYQWKEYGDRRIHLGSGATDVIPSMTPRIRTPKQEFQ